MSKKTESITGVFTPQEEADILDNVLNLLQKIKPIKDVRGRWEGMTSALLHDHAIAQTEDVQRLSQVSGDSPQLHLDDLLLLRNVGDLVKLLPSTPAA